MNVNQVAFGTTVALGAVTIGAAIGAATTASVVATVAYAILAVVSGGAGIAAVTSWLDPRAKDVSSYFQTMKQHAGVAIAGLVQMFAQVVLQSVVQGVAGGVGRAIENKIAGPQRLDIRVA